MSLETLLHDTLAEHALEAPPAGAIDGERLRRRSTQRHRRQQLTGVSAVAAVLATVALVVPRLLPTSDSAVTATEPAIPTAVPTLGTGECQGIRMVISLAADPQTVWPVLPKGTTITVPGGSVLHVTASGPRPCLDQLTYSADGTMLEGPYDQGSSGFIRDGIHLYVASTSVGATTEIEFSRGHEACVEGTAGIYVPPEPRGVCFGMGFIDTVAVVTVHVTGEPALHTTGRAPASS